MQDSSTEPEWKIRLTGALEADRAANIYSLATVESPLSTTSTSTSTSTTAELAAKFKPKARTVVHRAFLSLNASIIALQTTTDIRSAKSFQILNNNTAEVVWWFPKTSVQFRLQGRAYLLPSPSHQWRREFPPHSWKEEDRDWEAVRIESFNSLSSFLRASFARPLPPGSELKDPESSREWPNELPKFGEEENEKQKRLVQQALANFALLYVQVDEVDLVDLGVVPNERYLFSRRGDQWAKTVLVP